MLLPSSDFMQAWQTDWQAFWMQIESEIREAGSLSAISKRYAGATVEWTGLLEKLDLDPEFPSAVMVMPNLEINLSSGEVASIWGLTVPIKLGTEAKWQTYCPGMRMKFSAEIVPAWNPFGSFYDCEDEDGSRSFTVRVTDGRPLSKS